VSPREAFVDHLTLRVRDLGASRRFYAAALEPWGSRESEDDWGSSFGPPGSEDVAVAEGEPSAPIHLALSAPDRETVKRFYEAALSAGGRDNGPPGERPQYHPGYYAAYVLDPDGNNVEAVFHDRQEAE
jgi:catechol 2,3-dioxygenase-like lactoylglutathione lyase family enzyme